MASIPSPSSGTKRKIMWGGAGVLALLLAGYALAPDAFRRALGVDDGQGANRAGLAANQAAARGPGGLLGILQDIAERTPGIRIGGTALKGKPLFAGLGKGPTPVGNSVPGRRPRGEVASAGPAPGLPVFEQPVPAARPGIVLPDFPLAQAPSGPGTGGFPFPGGGGFVPPGGGGVIIPPGVPPTNPPVEPPPPPPPVPGIPEPSVWLVLVVGFGFIGHSMRRKQRVSFS